MSDVQPTSVEVEPESPDPAKGTSATRLVILLLIFGVALASLLYDYCVARPGIKKWDRAVQRLLEDSEADPNGDGTVSDDEVQSVLLCKPTSVQPLSNGKIEVYSWRSGLPFRTYNLYVVYMGQKTPLLYAASTNEEPTGAKLPPKTIIPPPMTEEERKNFVPPTPSFTSAGGKVGGGKVGGGKGRGKRPTAEGNNQDEPAADAGQDAREAKVAEKSEATPEPKKDEAAPTPPAPAEPAVEPAPHDEVTPEPAAQEERKTEPLPTDERKTDKPSTNSDGSDR